VNKQGKVTIRDVARLAGVAPSTVSMALANHSEIAEETRHLVREAAAKLRYTPNHAARSMRGELQRAIGVVIPHSSAHVFSHPYFMDILGGITEVANDHDFVVILSTAREEERGESAYIKMLRAQRVDGVILASAALFDRHVMELAVSGYPFVFLGRYPLNSEITAVGVDDVGGADMMTTHLLAHGYRSIVHVSGPLQHLSAVDRRDGFRRALGRAGIPAPDQDVIEGDYSEASGRVAAEQLLRRPRLPQAVFAGNDEMAYGLLDVFRERGARVPEDVALAGFDDLAIARVMTPALTTVHQPIVQLGATAAARLIAMVEQREPQQAQTVLPVTLSIRNSCGPEPI
jgi:DNA-binding LacI/PurR family transcriptional regulator